MSEPGKAKPGRGAREQRGPPGDPPEFRFFNEIGIIEQLARNAFERVMPGGLTLAQFSVLNHFARLGGPSHLVQLASAFQVSRAAMTKNVAKLRAKGLVTVTDDPRDGRSKLVDITAKGQALRDRAVDRLAPTLAAFQREFERPRIAAAIPLLEAVRSWLDEHR